MASNSTFSPRSRARLASGHLAALLLGLVLIVPDAKAIAFCALRDPDRQIRELFPESTAHLSSVALIDAKAREAVLQSLPFDFHAREFGRHTLYVVLNGDERIGFVHSRTEASNWGLMEVVWALDPDLRIRGFRFQRCRGPGCPVAQSESARELMEGRSATELLEALDNQSWQAAIASSPELAPHEELLEALARSAVKTIQVTAAIWNDEIG